MQRLALAVIAIAIVVAVIALVMRSIAREVENRGGLAELTTGGTMSRQPVDLRVADLSGEATYCGDVVGCQVPTCVCQSF